MLKLFLIVVIIFAVEYYYNPTKAIYDLKVIGISMVIIIPLFLVFIFFLNFFSKEDDDKK